MSKSKNKKILIIVSNFGREHGGVSSAMDIAEAIQRLNNDVYIGLIMQEPARYNNAIRKVYPSEIPPSRILKIPPAFCQKRPNYFNDYVAGIKSIVKKRNAHNATGKVFIRLAYELSVGLFYVFSAFMDGEIRKSKIYGLIGDANLIIIISNGLSADAVGRFRRISDAVIIRNHAASPKAFEKNMSLFELPPTDSHLPDYVRFMNQYDYVLFQSLSQARELEKRHIVLKGKSIVIPPSCEEQAIDLAKKTTSPFPPDSINIAVVGSIQPRKAQHKAIEAFSKLAEKYPSAYLHFVGGPAWGKQYLDGLQKVVKKSKYKERIRFHGHRKDYLIFMAHATVILQTSEAEGVSRILREAMYMQTPIVSFDISGTNDLLENNVDALLVAPGNINALAEAIETLIEDKALMEKLAVNAYEKYMRNNAKTVYINNWKKQLESLFH